MTPLERGQLVAGRFRIEELLGQGGMGQVYRALQLDLDREVALKILRPELSEAPGERARFRREAKVAAALRHHGAVQILDFGEDQGRLFLAMELLRGQTLRALLGHEGHPLDSLERSLAIAGQIADVLVAAHAIGLVHRDLKPSNIFLLTGGDGSERVVVADFGLAFIEHREDLGRLTRDGLLAGTPAYIAPEQALGRALSPAVDIYSLGCTLYEMLTGAVPFSDQSEVGVVTKHLFSLPSSPSEQRQSALPRLLDELTLSMLAKRPEERPSPSQVRAAIAQVLTRLDQRERSREELPLLRREERMLPPSLDVREEVTVNDRSPHPVNETKPSASRRVAIIGRLDDETKVALGANGLLVVALEAPDAEVIYAPEASEGEIAALCQQDLPIVTDTDANDLERLAALLRLGVDEVLASPVRPEELARRLHRALRRYRGRRSSE